MAKTLPPGQQQCGTAVAFKFLNRFGSAAEVPVLLLRGALALDTPVHPVLEPPAPPASVKLMEPNNDLLSSCQADLDKDLDYAAILRAGGYRTPAAVAAAASAARLQEACGLLAGDADILWSAAQVFRGTGVQGGPSIHKSPSERMHQTCISYPCKCLALTKCLHGASCAFHQEDSMLVHEIAPAESISKQTLKATP